MLTCVSSRRRSSRRRCFRIGPTTRVSPTSPRTEALPRVSRRPGVLRCRPGVGEPAAPAPQSGCWPTASASRKSAMAVGHSTAWSLATISSTLCLLRLGPDDTQRQGPSQHLTGHGPAPAIRDEASPARSTHDPKIVPRTAPHRRCVWSSRGRPGDDAEALCPSLAPAARARNLPETALRVTASRPTSRLSEAPSHLRGCLVTCGAVRRCEPPAHRW
jgi:hypothetical protein